MMIVLAGLSKGIRMSCFSCDDELQEWALDRLGDLLDAEVPPSWIIEKMIQVTVLPLHADPSEVEESEPPVVGAA